MFKFLGSTKEDRFASEFVSILFRAMVIKKIPKGGHTNWTQWFFPSMMATHLYRRFAPTPHSIDFPRQQRIIRRLAFAYFLTGWSVLFALGYYAYHRSEQGLLNPNVEVSYLAFSVSTVSIVQSCYVLMTRFVNFLFNLPRTTVTE